MSLCDKDLLVYLRPAKILCDEARQYAKAKRAQAASDEYSVIYKDQWCKFRRSKKFRSQYSKFEDVFFQKHLPALVDSKGKADRSNDPSKALATHGLDDRIVHSYFIRKIPGSKTGGNSNSDGTNLGIAVDHSRVLEMMQQYALGGIWSDTSATKGEPFHQYAWYRYGGGAGRQLRNCLEIWDLKPNVPMPESGDDLAAWERKVAALLKEAWPEADASLATCLYLRPHCDFLHKFMEDNKDPCNATWNAKQRDVGIRDWAQEVLPSCDHCGRGCDMVVWDGWEDKEVETVAVGGGGDSHKKKKQQTRYCLECHQQAPKSHEANPTRNWKDFQFLYKYIAAAMEVEGSILREDDETLRQTLMGELVHHEREDCGHTPHECSNETIHRNRMEPGSRLEMKAECKKYYSEEDLRFQITVYNMQTLRPKEAKPPDPSADNRDDEADNKPLFGRMIEFLRKEFCGRFSYLKTQMPCTSEAVLMDAEKKKISFDEKDEAKIAKSSATRFHLDPAWAFNMLMLWKPDEDREEAIGGGADWIFVSPDRCEEAVEYLRGKGLLEKKLTGRTMKEMYDTLYNRNQTGVWLIHQKHGEVVEVPVGYGHAVVNRGRNYKVALDVIPDGTLHRCQISFMYLAPLLRNGRVTNEYTHCMEMALNKLISHLPIDGTATNARKRKRTTMTLELENNGNGEKK